MKKLLKISIFSLVVFGFLFLANSSSVKAMGAINGGQEGPNLNVDALKAQIQALLQQIQQLQVQLAQLQGQPTQWCHNFNVNLKIEMGGNETKALQTALQKEGLLSQISDKFDENVASAVSGFQEKYKDEILIPLGLQYGTGFVGNATRTKLNKLYGCGIVKPPTTTPSITILSPNGGETWKVGEIRTISWNTNPGAGADKIVKISIGVRLAGATTGTAFVWVAGKIDDIGSYSWAVPAVYAGLVPSNYIVEVYGLNSMGENVATGKSAPFTITSITTQPSITVLSPNGGETWKIGETHNITWTSQGSSLPTNSSIDLLSWAPSTTSNQPVYLLDYKITTNAITSSGSYSWTVPSTSLIVPGNMYKINVTLGGSGTTFDYSDNYFSIVAVATTTSCTDSEGTVDNYFSKGNITAENAGGISYVRDSCLSEIRAIEGSSHIASQSLVAGGIITSSQLDNPNVLIESYCPSNIPSDLRDLRPFQKSYICPSGCSNGACVAAGTGLNDIQTQLASMAEAVAKLAEEIKGIRQ